MSMEWNTDYQKQNTVPANKEEAVPAPDRKASMIYERYRTGKTIILDDLRYLLWKDPEGCVKLMKSIVETKVGTVPEGDVPDATNTESLDMNAPNPPIQKSYTDRSKELSEVLETMQSLRKLLNRMNEKEQLDMLENLNEETELKRFSKNMKYWEDTFTDNIVRYTYEEQKEFDIRA